MCNKLAKVDFEQWNGFKGDRWKEKIDVRNFISMNYTPYDGDASFLEEPTEATDKLWGKLQELQKEERAKGGVLDMETEVVTGITAYGPGYIDAELKDLEQVVGLQTDKPLKRAFMPYGGIKMAEQACETYGYHVSDKIKDVFNNYEFKTHNHNIVSDKRKKSYKYLASSNHAPQGCLKCILEYRAYCPAAGSIPMNSRTRCWWACAAARAAKQLSAFYSSRALR